MTLLKEIDNRRSIRRFVLDFQIPENHIMTILEAARRSPSGTNSQPWRFVVVQDRTKIAELIEASYGQDYFKDSSCIIVCAADLKAKQQTEERLIELSDAGSFSKGEVIKFLSLGLRGKPEQDSAKAIRDTAIAVYGMMLQATALNLGSCWIAIRDKKIVKKSINLKDDNVVLVSMLALGKAAEAPAARPRLPIDKITFFEEWDLRFKI